MPNIRRTLFATLTAVVLTTSPGCAPDDPITVYESVPVTRQLDKGFDAAESAARYRMIVAIGQQPDATWFFKLTGTVEQVTSVETAWTDFLKSVRYSDGNPQWTLPEAWRQEASTSSMRFATIMTGEGNEAGEISVSSLPPGQSLTANVNRWRGQLGLRPIDDLQMFLALRDFQGDQAEFRVYDASGPKLDTGMGGAPFANLAGGNDEAKAVVSPHDGAMVPAAGDEPPPPESIGFREPPGWTAGKRTTFVAGRWSLPTDSGSLELSLLNMKPTAESWKLNVEAWARQVGISPEPDVEEITEEATVNDVSGRRARLDGPEGSVVVVMFEDLRGNGWVLKLAGSRADVDAQGAVLDEFLQSVSFIE